MEARYGRDENTLATAERNATSARNRPMLPGREYTALQVISHMVRARMTQAAVPILDEGGRYGRGHFLSEEFKRLNERGLRILDVTMGGFRFAPAVEDQIVRHWRTSWLDTAAAERVHVEQLEVLAVEAGKQRALLDHAMGSVQRPAQRRHGFRTSCAQGDAARRTRRAPDGREASRQRWRGAGGHLGTERSGWTYRTMTRLGDENLAPTPGMSAELRRLMRLTAASASRRLDRSFELSGAGAARRRVEALFGGVLFFAAAFGLHALLRWRAGAMMVPTADLSALAPDAVLIGWRILLVLGIAASLAVHFAGQFVQDVFELKDARVAWTFIDRLATGARGEVLHLREGRLSENDRKSPIIQIGGPGRIIVDTDTAALFEKPNGVAHVIGASGGAANGGDGGQAVAELDGFRATAGARDQST